MTNKKFTIKDIAMLAGVSKGTVDRVLHKRGKVSVKASMQVNRILKQIDYQPNLIARNLKVNKVYRIGVLLPDIKVDPYWISAYDGVNQATLEFKPFGVSVETYIYHPFEKNTFVESSRLALASSPDVLLMVPLFQKESLSILRLFKKANIRVAYFNNYVQNPTSEFFIGQDLLKSGKVAAGIIDKTLSAHSKISIVHVDWEPHMQLKETGFKDYFKNRTKSDVQINTERFRTDSTKEITRQYNDYLSKNPSISALFFTNSKVYTFAPILKKLKYHGIIVGYDLLPDNIDLLKSGGIDFLLHQRPKEQAYLGIVYFAEFFLFGKKIPQQKFLPIDIAIAENVDYYSK